MTTKMENPNIITKRSTIDNSTVYTYLRVVFVERGDLPDFELAKIPGVIDDASVFAGRNRLQGHDFDVARSDGQQMIRTAEVRGEG